MKIKNAELFGNLRYSTTLKRTTWVPGPRGSDYRAQKRNVETDFNTDLVWATQRTFCSDASTRLIGNLSRGRAIEHRPP